jgi:hypothetical protein
MLLQPLAEWDAVRLCGALRRPGCRGKQSRSPYGMVRGYRFASMLLTLR